MRRLVPLVVGVLCGCAASPTAPPTPQTIGSSAVPSIEQISAPPTLACDSQAAARREVRVRHIAVEAFARGSNIVAAATPDELFDAYQRVALAREHLVEGESFETVWEKYSDPQTSGGKVDGDLGFFKRGELVPDFERVAFCLPVGEISPVFRTLFGFHVAQVTDVHY